MAEQPMTAEAVQQALGDMKDPETGRSLVRTGQIRDVQAEGNRVQLTLALTSHSAPLHEEVRQAVLEQLRAKFPQAESIEVNLALHHRPPTKAGQVGLTAKTVVAVGSGKGGVGKSTIAACLAYALKRAGCSVGLMDADVYGPSIPKLTGVSATPEDVTRQKGLRPIDWQGIPVMSIGFLVQEDQAVIWRGPMLHKLVNDFLALTDWGELDYLIVDMPPGTGDVALSLSQFLPEQAGAVVVCTPQQLALLDAVKAIDMLRKVKMPVFGLVENMSGFICPTCNKRYDIFGSGGARQRAEQLGIPFLGEVPINIQLRQRGDEGTSAANFEDPAVAPHLERLAYQLVRSVAQRAAQQPSRPQLPVLG